MSDVSLWSRCLAAGQEAVRGRLASSRDGFPKRVSPEQTIILACALADRRKASEVLARTLPAVTDWPGLRLKIEMRGVKGNAMHTVTLEKPAVKNGWLSNWAEVRLTGRDYADFGEMVAWRASLWDGPRELSAQQSYLWSGVPASIK